MKRILGSMLLLACLPSCAQQPQPLSAQAAPHPMSQPVIVPQISEQRAAAPVLGGLAAPTAAYEDAQQVPQTLVMPTAAAPSQAVQVQAPQAFVAPAQAAVPVTIMPQAAPAYEAPALVDPDRPTPPPLAAIVIPSGNATENNSGWGRR